LIIEVDLRRAFRLPPFFLFSQINPTRLPSPPTHLADLLSPFPAFCSHLTADAAPLKSLLTHLTSRSTFPNILLGFVPLGGGDEIELLFAEGGLGKKFKNAGLRVNA